MHLSIDFRPSVYSYRGIFSVLVTLMCTCVVVLTQAAELWLTVHCVAGVRNTTQVNRWPGDQHTKNTSVIIRILLSSSGNVSLIAWAHLCPLIALKPLEFCLKIIPLGMYQSACGTQSSLCSLPNSPLTENFWMQPRITVNLLFWVGMLNARVWWMFRLAASF